MTENQRCHRCGQLLPADAPEGICPACKLRTQLELGSEPSTSADSASANVTFSFETAQAGHVLESLARSIGSIPRVLLPETGADDTGLAITHPSFDVTTTPAPAERGDRYQFFGEIARGGMGAVLRARDPDFGRDLAVKVLLESHEDKPEMLRRFVEEAPIGGQLQHPGIVPVYELGTFADRRPYFTMKLVKGRTLSALLAERPFPAHDLPRFLSIFEAICQTMAYSHARGVIHRDLKPSNVMVGSFGEVQVMDWGLAKVLKDGDVADKAPSQPTADEIPVVTVRSDSNLDESQAGSVLGTPAYMAPEQAAGETERVDRRADVFGLGSILCEILTGQPAFTGRGAVEILRTAMRCDTADALARLDGCGAGAELIALAKECLAREPADRPPQAGTLAERVTAYFSGAQDRLRAAEIARAAESARAEEAIVRARAERRARQFQVGLAAALLLLTTAGGLTFTYLLQERQRREARFAQVLSEATALRDKALRQPGDPAAWRDALAALEQAEGQGPADQVETLRGAIQAGLDKAERDARLRQALVEVRANKEDVGADGTDAAYAAAFRATELDLDALEPAEFARRLRSQGEPAAIELAAFLDDWSAVRSGAGRPVAAWRKPLEAARLADPEPYRDRLRGILLAENRKSHVEALRALATAREASELPAPTAVLLGTTLADLGHAEAAVTLLRPAADRVPGDVWVNYALAGALAKLRPAARDEAVRYYTAARALRPETGHDLAHLFEGMGRGTEAESVFRDLAKRRPENARHLGCLATQMAQSGRAADAAPVLERAIAAYREAIRLKPDLPLAHASLGAILCDVKHDYAGAEAEFRETIRLNPDFALAHKDLGAALSGQGKLSEAIAAYHEAIRLSPDFAEAHDGLGITLRDQGKLSEAIAAYREAIRLKPDLASAHHNLGYALGRQGKLSEAIAAYGEAIRLKPDYALAHHSLGVILCDVKHDYTGAEAEFREAIRLRPDLETAHGNLGITLARQGKVSEAIAAYGEAIRLKPDLPSAHSNLGAILCDVKHDYTGAEAEFRAEIRLNPDFALAHQNLGIALSGQGKVSEAIAAYREAIRLNPDFAKAHVNLGDALGTQGKHDEAIAEYRTAVKLNPDLAEARVSLGNALRAQGKHDEAVALLPAVAAQVGTTAARAQSLGVGDPAPKLGVKSFVKGDPIAALEPGRVYAEVTNLRNEIKLRPDDGGLYSNYGRILGNLGRHDEAIEACRKSIKLNPKDGGAHYNLGNSLAAQGHLRDALAAFAEAERVEPSLWQSREWQLRYQAACAAARAAAGEGKDEPPPDDAAKAKLRGQALDWLRAEYKAWVQLLESGTPGARARIADTLRHWKQHSDLAGIRDDEALARLPEVERKEWQALWADVNLLQSRAATTSATETKPSGT